MRVRPAWCRLLVRETNLEDVMVDAQGIDMEWRSVPEAVMVTGHGMQPVTSARFVPAGKHDGRVIRAEWGRLELVTPKGSRFYGCAEARITSELRMVVRGTPKADEVRMAWPVATVTA